MFIRSLQDRSISEVNPFNKSNKAKFYANATIKKYDAVALDDDGRVISTSYIFNNPSGRFDNYYISSSIGSAYDYRADIIQLNQDHYVMAVVQGGNTIRVDVFQKIEPVRTNQTLTQRATSSGIGSSVDGLALCKVNDSLFAITYRGASGYWYCVIGDFNATTGTLSFGTPFTVEPSIVYSNGLAAVSLGNNRIVVFGSMQTPGQIWGKIIDVVDKNNVTLRTTYLIVSEVGAYLKAVALNNTEIILAYGATGVGRGVGVDVSGNTLLSGTTSTFYSAQTAYCLNMKHWKGNTVFVSFRDGNSPMYCRMAKLTKSGSIISSTWAAMLDNITIGTTQVAIPREDLGFIFGVNNGSVAIWPFTIDTNGNFTLKNYLSSSFTVNSATAFHILPINATTLLIMNDYTGSNHYYGLMSDLYYKDAIGIALNDATAGQSVDVALI
jgi:hypothetical protein